MNGIELIKNHIEDLIKLIATTSLWAPPVVVEKLFSEENNPTASWYKNTRRLRVRDKEIKNTFKEGIYLDDNTKANIAIKAAVGLKKPKNFATCHIYDNSTYDCRYHTAIPNLVLIPRPIYSLTDHLEECKDFLKYYSFTRYGFYKDSIPKKPDFWDTINLESMIEPTTEQVERALLSVNKRTRYISNKREG